MRATSASLLAAVIIAAAPSARAADVLGVTFGDSPGLVAAKLRDYAETTYGDYYTRRVSPGELDRLRKTALEASTPAEAAEARDTLEHSTLEVGGRADANGRPVLQYLAAKLLPFRQVQSVDHEDITVAFSGLASGNVAFKIQRYLTFKIGSLPAIIESPPVGVAGMSIGVGVDALRASLVQSFGSPASETDLDNPAHTDASTRTYHYAEHLKILAYQIGPAGKPDPAMSANLAPCIMGAETADLASRHPGEDAASDVSACPALLMFQIHTLRPPMVNRFDEFLVNYPELKSLSDQDETDAKKAEAAAAAVMTGGGAAREQVRQEQEAAAERGPVTLHY